MNIYFDESGNTGVNLSDPAQPVFALASVSLEIDVARSLAESLVRPGQHEAKYTSLSASTAGQRALIELFKSPHLSPATAKVAVTDKRYYLISHLVDKLIEPVFHVKGIDLYAGARHVEYANVLYQAGQILFPEGGWQNILDSFLKTLRDDSDLVLQNLEAAVLEAARKAPPGYDVFVVPLTLGARNAGTLLEGLAGLGTFDPAIDAFNAVVQAWMSGTTEPLCVVHDTSKPMKKAESFLRQLMSSSVESRTIGYENRTAVLPMRVSTLDFADSREHPQLQIADILAGAARDCITARLSSKKWTTFHETALPLIDTFVVNRMLPNPASISVAERLPAPGSVSLVDGAVRFLMETGYAF
ncbi:DUF3800 domain-containing protein [Paraburkholderia sp. MMS20-SJTR3]|uniref:DUF3800 domain-containing protein n=1 Tax=Paraburkholderia sejongensis TaxID=2886946 RepID=A0ABS8K641_9BURK|nr:DUF3800 domain-containing protein [Paraburkholderia sp. MMS20-SJTR3]MCC8397637.1 DUF3800 domain-containing protein [Paraburkholderia sp. MMS20-SJTR3]